ncbi:MAG: transporter [Cytophagales bacterium]
MNSNLQRLWLLFTIFGVFLLVRVEPLLGQNAESANDKHGSCHSHDQSPVGVMFSHIHPSKSFMFSYRFMSMAMNDKLSGTRNVADNEVFTNYLMLPKQMRMDMHMLMAMYGLSNKITLMAMVNYNVFSMEMSMLPSNANASSSHSQHNHSDHDHMAMKTSGIGDTKLYVLYDLIQKNEYQFLLNFGVSIPTGDINIAGNEANMYPSSRLPYSMQLGSGSYELLPGITYSTKFRSISASLQALYIHRIHANSVGYRLGNECVANAWAAYQLTKWLSFSMRAEGIFSSPIRGADNSIYYLSEPAANTANYGGQKVNAFGGLNYFPKIGFLQTARLSLEYGLPVYQNLNGIQSATSGTLIAGLQVDF